VGILLAAAAALSAFGAFSAIRPAEAGWLDKVKKAAEDVSKGAARSREKRRGGKGVSQSHAAVRGLEEDHSAGEGPDARDFEGLEWLESLEITENEVARFVREGRLGR